MFNGLADYHREQPFVLEFVISVEYPRSSDPDFPFVRSLGSNVQRVVRGKRSDARTMSVHVRGVVGIMFEKRAKVPVAYNRQKERVPDSHASINHANGRRVVRRGYKRTEAPDIKSFGRFAECLKRRSLFEPCYARLPFRLLDQPTKKATRATNNRSECVLNQLVLKKFPWMPFRNAFMRSSRAFINSLAGFFVPDARDMSSISQVTHGSLISSSYLP